MDLREANWRPNISIIERFQRRRRILRRTSRRAVSSATVRQTLVPDFEALRLEHKRTLSTRYFSRQVRHHAVNRKVEELSLIWAQPLKAIFQSGHSIWAVNLGTGLMTFIQIILIKMALQAFFEHLTGNYLQLKFPVR